jgi:hypothetical protein
MLAPIGPLAALLLACGATGETLDDEATGRVSSALAGPAVTTQRNDIGRTGGNLSETTLTTSKVKTATFGKVYTRNVRGSIYAQPLYVAGLTVNGAVQNGRHEVEGPDVRGLDRVGQHADRRAFQSGRVRRVRQPLKRPWGSALVG